MCDVGQVHYFVYVIVSAPLFEKPAFRPLNIFIPLSKISWIYLCGAVFGFSVSFFIIFHMAVKEAHEQTISINQ